MALIIKLFRCIKVVARGYISLCRNDFIEEVEGITASLTVGFASLLERRSVLNSADGDQLTLVGEPKWL